MSTLVHNFDDNETSPAFVIQPNRICRIFVGEEAAQDFGSGSLQVLISWDGGTSFGILENALTVPDALEVITYDESALVKATLSGATLPDLDFRQHQDPYPPGRG